jgi:Lon protease-like protein
MSDPRPEPWALLPGDPAEESDREERLVRRIDRAAQSLLENETLTADVDDAAASVILDRGIAFARQIAQSTAGMDDAQAEEAMYDRMRAVRRLMRSVNRWVATRRETSAENSDRLWARIAAQAEILYCGSLAPLSPCEHNALLIQSQILDPPRLVAYLCALIESLRERSTTELA